jgi:hypothetical protein
MAAPARKITIEQAADQSFGWNYQAGCPIAPYFTGMGQKTANIDIRVRPQLVEWIDAWRGRQRVPPSRTAAIVYMIEQFLKHDPELNKRGDLCSPADLK